MGSLVADDITRSGVRPPSQSYDQPPGLWQGQLASPPAFQPKLRVLLFSIRLRHMRNLLRLVADGTFSLVHVV